MSTEDQNHRSPFLGKRLWMPGLKPSDYYLYDQERKHFSFDMRQLFVLGLRLIYACQHGQITKEQMYDFIQAIRTENLDLEHIDTRPTYKPFATI